MTGLLITFWQTIGTVCAWVSDHFAVGSAYAASRVLRLRDRLRGRL